jgi:hypothetical protein
VDTLTARRYSPHWMNWVDLTCFRETCKQNRQTVFAIVCMTRQVHPVLARWAPFLA